MWARTTRCSRPGLPTRASPTRAPGLLPTPARPAGRASPSCARCGLSRIQESSMRTLLICLCLALVSPWAQAERLKDIASIAGIRSNQLIGYGLVVGLDGSGDQTTQTPFTVQTFNNMLTEFGITVPP